MAASTLTRPSITDDSGDGVSGTIYNAAFFASIFDAIDALFSSTAGITLNQAGGDGAILTLESSDVAHGLSGAPSTSTFGSFIKNNGPTGGLWMTGFQATGIDQGALILAGNNKDAGQTTKSTANYGIIRLRVQVNSGAAAANANLVSVENNGTSRFFLDADGDSHQDVGTAWTNFDDYHDVELLHALSAAVSRKGDPLRRAFGRLLTKHRPALERARIVTFNKNGHHFVNWSRLNMLVIGAVRQQAVALAKTQREVQTMKTRLRAKAA